MTHETTKKMDLTFEELRDLIDGAVADLSDEGTPREGWSHAEALRHQMNLALFNLRKVKLVLDTAEDV